MLYRGAVRRADPGKLAGSGAVRMRNEELGMRNWGPGEAGAARERAVNSERSEELRREGFARLSMLNQTGDPARAQRSGACGELGMRNSASGRGQALCYRECARCGEVWNVSAIGMWTDVYICPDCERREKKKLKKQRKLKNEKG